MISYLAPPCDKLRGMAQVFTAESDDPEVGGVVVTFPSGATKSIAWKSQAPIIEHLDAAKEYVTKLVQNMLDSGLVDDLERTNIPSLVAAVQKNIIDWNNKQRARLYAAPIQ